MRSPPRAEVVNVEDVRMRERGDRARLAFEPGKSVRIAGEAR